jgi:hypothetical protein
VEDYFEINDRQRRYYLDTCQLWEAYVALRDEYDRLPIGMYWRQYKNVESLTKSYRDPKSGVQKYNTIGSRSPQTEMIKENFEKAKSETKERLQSIKSEINEQARVNKAARMGHIPKTPARILVALKKYGLLGRNLQVVGTHAMFAYEAVAGVVFRSGIMETGDIDLLFDARSCLRLRVREDIEPISVLRIMQKSDQSFKIAQGSGFAALNKQGFRVDIIKPEPRPPWREEKRSFFDDGDLLAAEIKGLEWVQNSQKLEAVCISTDGYPVPIVAPDPRAFILHKLWVGILAENRDPIKRKKDVKQAKALASVLHAYLPGKYRFADSELKIFPKEIIDVMKQYLTDFWD